MPDEQTLSISGWLSLSELSGLKIILEGGTNQPQVYTSGSQLYCSIFGIGIAGIASPISENTWTHFCFVIRGPEDREVFINGVGSGPNTATAPISGLSGQTYTWGSRGGSTYFSSGKNADFRIFDRVLSQNEIDQLSACPNPGLLGDEAGAWLGDADDLSDLSGNGNNATEGDGGNPTVYLPTGPCDTAYKPTFGNASREFDGVDDYVDCGGAASGITSAFSLSAWVKFSSLVLWDSIVSQSSDPALIDGFGFYVYGSDTVGFWVNSWSASKVTHLLTNPTGQWYHLTGTWDGATMEFFVDGTSVGTEAESGALSLVGSLELGRGFDDAYNLDGNLADVRIYNRVLSPQEIADIYNNDNASPIRDGLVGQWITDENEPPAGSDTIIDWSGNQNDGQNGGSAYDGADGPFV